MSLPWVRCIPINLVSGIQHDIRHGAGLAQIVQLANCRAVVKALVERWIFLEGMELKCNLCWDSLGL
jgi:hypothetical protein